MTLSRLVTQDLSSLPAFLKKIGFKSVTFSYPLKKLGSSYLFLFIATAGTTITPFMQLYVQSAVVEKGVGPAELNAERAEVVTGSISHAVGELDFQVARRSLR